jgi:hypothetical protein
VSGSAPILDIELTAFEELRGQPPEARVAITFSLRDDRHSFAERSLDLKRPLVPRPGSDAAQCLAETLTRTLDEAVRQVGNEVVEALRVAHAASVKPESDGSR